MATLNPHPTKAYLVTVDGRQEYFQRCTAPEDSLESNDYTDPSKGRSYRTYSFRSVTTVTLSKLYDPAKDAGLLEWMNQRFTDRTRFSVTITPVNPDAEGTPVAGARSLVLTECQLIRRRLPEVDRNASGLSMLEMELDVRDWSTQ